MKTLTPFGEWAPKTLINPLLKFFCLPEKLKGISQTRQTFSWESYELPWKKNRSRFFVFQNLITLNEPTFCVAQIIKVNIGMCVRYVSVCLCVYFTAQKRGFWLKGQWPDVSIFREVSSSCGMYPCKSNTNLIIQAKKNTFEKFISAKM